MTKEEFRQLQVGDVFFYKIFPRHGDLCSLYLSKINTINSAHWKEHHVCVKDLWGTDKRMMSDRNAITENCLDLATFIKLDSSLFCDDFEKNEKVLKNILPEEFI